MTAWLNSALLEPIAATSLEPGDIALMPSFISEEPLRVALVFASVRPVGIRRRYFALTPLFRSVKSGGWLDVSKDADMVLRVKASGVASLEVDLNSPKIGEDEPGALLTESGFRLFTRDREGPFGGLEIDPVTWTTDEAPSWRPTSHVTAGWRVTLSLSDGRHLSFLPDGRALLAEQR